MATCTNPSCQVEFTPKRGSTGKFCSSSCSATVSNLNRKRTRKSGVYACMFCGEPVKADNKFCSLTHAAAYRSARIAEARAEGATQAVTDAERQRLYLMRRRQKAKDFLGGTCAVCGRSENLEFDHIDPSTKSIEISEAIKKHWAWDRLVEELQKCQLLCRGHHIDKSSVESRAQMVHGKEYAALKLKCCCELCVAYKRPKRPKGPGRAMSDHGTRARYLQEVRTGEGTCAACRAANAAYTAKAKERLAQR